LSVFWLLIVESGLQKEMKKLCRFPKQEYSGAPYAVGCKLVDEKINSYGCMFRGGSPIKKENY